MENLALTTVLIFVFAVPGYIALSTYHSGTLTKAVLPSDLPGDLAKAFLISLPIHWFGIFIVEHTHHLTGVIPDINFKLVGRLITGNYGPESQLFMGDIDSLYQYSHFLIAYVVFLLFLSSVGGWVIRKSVWWGRLDLRLQAIFGFRNQWLYYLTGRKLLLTDPSKKVIPMVDVLMDIGEKTRLYRGIVGEFRTDSEGGLQELFLISALRGKFRKGLGEVEEFYWQEIPGDRFVVNYSRVVNFNITYIQVPQNSPPQN